MLGMGRLNRFGVRHIQHIHLAPAFGFEGVKGGGVHIGGDDMRAFTHKSQCGGTANALSSGCDEGGFAC
jgi:hypothetical protein